MRGMTGREWVAPIVSEGDDILSHILDARGISEGDRADFLSPPAKQALPEPYQLMGMKEASTRLAEDVVRSRKIGIYTDYDADGATSAGVLGRWARNAGNGIHALVAPDRIRHGYGPNADLIRDMFDKGCETVYVLDSGTVAKPVFDQLTAEQRANIFVIDHHMPAGELPDIGAVVNPNRLDQRPGLGHLAAVGVTFLLCVAAQRNLINIGVAQKQSMRGVMDLLDYVAVGTVCDVVPLRGVNRAFVHHGMRMVSRDVSNPLGALLEAAGKKRSSPVVASDFGFVIGPRLNAEGRIGDSTAAARFLLETDAAVIAKTAKHLSEVNMKRQSMDKAATSAAIESADQHPESLVKIAVTEAHEGVVGISASKLKDRYDAPAMVLTTTPDGHLKGSARSVDGFNIGEAIHHAVDKNIVIKGGGHAMAGGLTVSPDKLDELRDHMDEEFRMSEAFRSERQSRFDAFLPPEMVSVDMRKRLDALEPFGRDNPQPRFVVSGTVRNVFIMSGKHVKASLEHDGHHLLDAIIWGGIGTPAGDMLGDSKGKKISVAGAIEVNQFNGRESLQMIVEDIQLSVGPELSLG